MEEGVTCDLLGVSWSEWEFGRESGGGLYLGSARSLPRGHPKGSASLERNTHYEPLPKKVPPLSRWGFSKKEYLAGKSVCGGSISLVFFPEKHFCHRIIRSLANLSFCAIFVPMLLEKIHRHLCFGTASFRSRSPFLLIFRDPPFQHLFLVEMVCQIFLPFFFTYAKEWKKSPARWVAH